MGAPALKCGDARLLAGLGGGSNPVADAKPLSNRRASLYLPESLFNS
jgi:hypothetical protein